LRSTVPSFGRPRNRLGVAQSVCVACLRWPQRQSPAIRCGEDRLPTRGQDTAIGAEAERTRTPTTRDPAADETGNSSTSKPAGSGRVGRSASRSPSGSLPELDAGGERPPTLRPAHLVQRLGRLLGEQDDDVWRSSTRRRTRRRPRRSSSLLLLGTPPSSPGRPPGHGSRVGWSSPGARSRAGGYGRP
jgi:hypothetical protein